LELRGRARRSLTGRVPLNDATRVTRNRAGRTSGNDPHVRAEPGVHVASHRLRKAPSPTPAARRRQRSTAVEPIIDCSYEPMRCAHRLVPPRRAAGSSTLVSPLAASSRASRSSPYGFTTLVNHNKLVSDHLYAGANGIQTGFTEQAQHTLIATATRHGRQPDRRHHSSPTTLRLGPPAPRHRLREPPAGTATGEPPGARVTTYRQRADPVLGVREARRASARSERSARPLNGLDDQCKQAALTHRAHASCSGRPRRARQIKNKNMLSLHRHHPEAPRRRRSATHTRPKYLLSFTARRLTGGTLYFLASARRTLASAAPPPPRRRLSTNSMMRRCSLPVSTVLYRTGTPCLDRSIALADPRETPRGEGRQPSADRLGAPLDERLGRFRRGASRDRARLGSFREHLDDLGSRDLALLQPPPSSPRSRGEKR